MLKFNQHQRTMFRYCIEHENPMLFVEMRLRKSLVAIRWIETLVDVGNILIIAPYSAIWGWMTQLGTEEHFNVFQLVGSKTKRIELLNSKYAQSKLILNWFIINPEFVRYDKRLSEEEKKIRKKSRSLWVSDLAVEIAQRHWDVIIFDECTYLQNHRNTISQFFLKLPINSSYRIGLTGTPATEGLQQFYPMCQIIEPETFVEKNYYEFEFKRFQVLPNHNLWCSEKNQKYIHTRLSKYAFFLSRDTLKLGGEIIREIRTVDQSPKTKKVYEVTEEEFLLEIKEVKVSKSTIFAMTRYQWLRRICGGIVENNIIDRAKMNLLCSLIKKEFFREQVIIWCNFIDEILNLEKILRKAKFKITTIYGKIKPDQRELRRIKFMKKQIQIIICQPSCFRFGIDLSISTTMIYYSLPNSSLTYWQSESRPVNLDKVDSILVIYLLVKNTIDFAVYDGLMKKESRQKLTKRIVQDIQRRNNEG